MAEQESGTERKDFQDVRQETLSAMSGQEATNGGELKWSQMLFGKPLDVYNQTTFKHFTLIALFAWVAVGSDLLSSSCYGPPESFRELGDLRYLAVFLGLATIATVCIIALCYSRIVEVFPHGGGGYVVATKLLGAPFGVVSGCALLVDYVLTITVSISSAGDAVFGMLDPSLSKWKLPAELLCAGFLTLINLRGVKESVIILFPIFVVFLVTHVILVAGAIGLNLDVLGEVTEGISHQMAADAASPSIGVWGMLAVLLKAYSMGAGTYTGIEAVSNSMPLLREPRIRTARWTLFFMGASMSFIAGGLLFAYLLLRLVPGDHETLNHLLASTLVSQAGYGGHWAGNLFVLITMFAEGALLVVAAQAGFVDGPRVLATMALDGWVPNRFASLSERLTATYGVVLMGAASLVLLLISRGQVGYLVVMYSINVFVTFSLSMISMCRYWRAKRGSSPVWGRRLALFSVGAALCASILAVSVVSKFTEGGWHTIAATSFCIFVCYLTRGHYTRVARRMAEVDAESAQLPSSATPTDEAVDPTQPTAVVLVPIFGGLGLQTFLTAMRFFPGYFKNALFLSVGVVDSGVFKGEDGVESLRRHTQESLDWYVAFARRMGVPATSMTAIGADALRELEQLSILAAQQFPRATFFASNLVFAKDTWVSRLLHNQIAFALQQRLQRAGLPIVILPFE